MVGTLGVSYAGLSAASDAFAQRAAAVATPGPAREDLRPQGAQTQTAPAPANDAQTARDRDFTKNYTGMLADKAAFEANAAAARTADDMAGVLLDIIA